MADGLNTLLTTATDEKNQNNNDNDDVANMIEKGQEIIGDTLENINKNMATLRDKVKSEFPTLKKLDDPIKKLKDKIFPAKSSSSPSSVASSAVSVSNGSPQVFGFDNSGVFHEDFFSSNNKFNFGKRTQDTKDDDNVDKTKDDQMLLIFPDDFDVEDDYNEDYLQK